MFYIINKTKKTLDPVRTSDNKFPDLYLPPPPPSPFPPPPPLTPIPPSTLFVALPLIKQVTSNHLLTDVTKIRTK